MQRDETIFYDSLGQLELKGYKVLYLWNWASTEPLLSQAIPRLFAVFGPEGILFIGMPHPAEISIQTVDAYLQSLKSYSQEMMELFKSIDPDFDLIACKIRLWLPETLPCTSTPSDANSGVLSNPREWVDDIDRLFVTMRSPGAKLLADIPLHNLEEQISLKGCQCVARSQFKPLDFPDLPHPLCASVLFKGGPGTGKTVQLLSHSEIALRQGQKVLIVCYNRPLYLYLKREISNFPGCIVLPLLTYCEILAQKTNNLPYTSPDDSNYWSDTLPKSALAFLQAVPAIFDMICIDESQDLRHELWWNVLQSSLKSSGSWALAWDPGQGIYLDQSHENQISPQTFFPPKIQSKELHINYRNHKKITAELNRSNYWKLESAYRDQRLSGGHIEYLQCSQDPHAWQRALSAILKTLPTPAGHLLEPGIAILGPRRFENSVLAQVDHLKFGSYEIASEKDIQEYNPHQIPYYTVHRFKGLEADKIILLGFGDRDRNEKMHRLFYLGLSRARSDIWVIDP